MGRWRRSMCWGCTGLLTVMSTSRKSFLRPYTHQYPAFPPHQSSGEQEVSEAQRTRVCPRAWP